MSSRSFDVLLAARRVAELATGEGALGTPAKVRPTLGHMGAVIADAVLQAGLNYASVVRPRVTAILENYPHADRVSALVKLVEEGRVESFLNWVHPTKVCRFQDLVRFLSESSVETAAELRVRLGCSGFCTALRTVSGVGPKTVDYLACLVGIDSVAVDRHVRTYAVRAGVESRDYDFLRDVFCSAADLLSVSRRTFDAWVWRVESSAPKRTQLALEL